jgi:hypothetical protein
MELTEKQKETLKRNNEESNFVTREAAQEALFLLMKEQDYEEIVKRMIDACQKNAVVMLSGVIPEENWEKILSHFKK